MKLFRDYAVLAAGQIASRALGLLAFAWLARILDPEAYGGIEYLIGLALLGGYVVDGGSSLVGVRRAAETPSGLSELALGIFAVRALFALVAVPAVAAVALFTTSTLPPGLVWLFAATLLFVPWRHEWMFQATGRMASVAAAQTLRAAVFAALAWTLVCASSDVVSVGWAEFCAVAAYTGYCVYLQHPRVAAFRLRGSLPGFATLVRESAAVGVSNSVWAMGQYAPLLMIGASVGGVQTAWLAAAARIVGSLLIVPYVYHFGLYPSVVRSVRQPDELRALLMRSCRVAAWGGVFVALTLMLFAQPITVLVLGAKLGPSAPLLQVMAWILPVSLCSDHALSVLAASGAQTRLLRARFASLGTIVIVGLGLGPALGAMGYAFAALAGPLALWVVAHRSARRIGLQAPSFGLLAKPAALAVGIAVAASQSASGLWLSAAYLALYVAVAPLVDRTLLRDVCGLGRAGLDTDAARR